MEGYLRILALISGRMALSPVALPVLWLRKDLRFSVVVGNNEICGEKGFVCPVNSTIITHLIAVLTVISPVGNFVFRNSAGFW